MVEYQWLHELSEKELRAVAFLYVDAFKESLILLNPGVQAWYCVAETAINPRRTLVAIDKGEMVAAVSYSPPLLRDAIIVEFPDILEAFGSEQGRSACCVMWHEFSKALPDKIILLPYIELLAVAPACQRQGHAAALVRELTDRLGYSSYTIQVDDNNEGAFDLYRKLGFFEVLREPEPWSAAQKAGTMERVFMQLNVSDGSTKGSPHVEARTDSDRG